MSGSKKAIEDEEERKIDPATMTVEEIKFYIAELEEQMDLAAKNLEFETAARIRDKLAEIKKIKHLQKSGH
jgi:excinuclease ABC subunit B